MGKTSAAVKNRYNLKVYDRVYLLTRKGTKDNIQAIARAQGLSLNGYIKKAIQRQYKADTGEDITL